MTTRALATRPGPRLQAGRRHLALEENGTLELPLDGPGSLSESEVAALSRLRELRVTRTGARWRIEAAPNRVGALATDTLEVTIRPKVPVTSVLALLGYTSKVRILPGDVHALPGAELVGALAYSLARQAERALRTGPLRAYRWREETSWRARGRLRIGRQISRHQGRPLPLEVTVRERSIDCAENRILAAALRVMSGVPRVPADVRRRLAASAALLRDVAPLTPGAPLPRVHLTRLNEHYGPALALASLIWRYLGADADWHASASPGQTQLAAFTLDMARVFEDFVSVRLAEAAPEVGVLVRPQWRMALDTDGEFTVLPDLTVLRRGAAGEAPRTLAVADVKYARAVATDHLYQVAAYAQRLDLAEAHLIYPTDVGRTRVELRGSGVHVHIHALDLAAPHDALRRQGGDLLRTLAGE
ncbi:MAG: hypothetical protein Q4P36_08665 [Bowdeniella nasicola]|nr:hypothetical protein [Bowdeniella nasicola]